MTTTDKTLRSSINGKLYKTDIVDGKKQVIEIQDLSFLNKNEEGTYIPRYNIENSRLLLENSEPSEPPTDAEVKDFIKEDQVEFPARTQIRNWVRQELYPIEAGILDCSTPKRVKHLITLTLN